MDARLPRRIRMALRSLLRRRTAERELDEELQFHLQQLAEHEVARGEEPSAAQWRVRRHVGSLDRVKEACRDMRTLRPVEHVLQDLRFGARLLARGPGFTAVAVLSLALGIGASSALVSLLNAIVLRHLPVADPQALFIAQATEPDAVNLQFSSPVVERAIALLGGRAEVAAQSSIESVLIAARGGGAAAVAAETARLQLVAGDFFGALRQRAQIGRLLGPGDNRSPGQHPVAVISDRYWSRRFGRSPSVLDTELVINGAAMRIVGVTGRSFFGATVAAQTPDVWAPAAMQADLRFAGDFRRTGGDLRKSWGAQPEVTWLQVVVRTPAGAAPAVADALTLALHRERPPAEGPEAGAARVRLLPGSRGFSPMRRELTIPLLVLLVTVTLLLAMACANIASLLLARAPIRSREMAIRLSMGAEPGRLIRQLLTESLLLGAAGGAAGLALAYWGSTGLLVLLTRGQPVVGIDVTPDWRVIGHAFAATLASGVGIGLLPAIHAARVPLADTLKAQTRSAIGAARRVPIGKLLIAGQMAVAIPLLLLAALFGQSLRALAQVDVGYDRDRLLVARIDPRSAGYAEAELPALHARVVDDLMRLPGVAAVSLSAGGPFSGSRNRGDLGIEGYTPGRRESMTTLKEWVTPDYFRTVGLAIRQGRGFGPQDSAAGRRVAVISEALARRYFHGRSPLGRRMNWGGSDFDAGGFEIVGVVDDARYNDVRGESLNMAYLPASQDQRYLTSVEVRAEGDPAPLTSAVRSALRESEPRLAVSAIDTLDSRIVGSLRIERLLGWLTMAFGAAALGLACLGLYGTISHAVRQRTAELGLRIALGADRAAMQWLIVREALQLVLAGGAIGLPIAFLAARAVGGMLYGTAPSDPLAYVAAAAVLVAVSAFAAYLPARRASRLDPIAALRSD